MLRYVSVKRTPQYFCFKVRNMQSFVLKYFVHLP